MNNKYLLIILAFLIIVIFAVDLNNKEGGIITQTKHFDNGVLSFDYPATWNEINNSESNIVSFSDSNGNITISKSSIPKGYDLAKRSQLNAAGTVDNNFQLVSSRNISINGLTGYESDYNWNTKNGQQQRREILFEKNNALYSIVYTAPGKINENEGIFVLNSGNPLDTLINSLNINTTKNDPVKISGWAELIMPDIGGDWPVTSNSVNDPAVYHIPTSYYPGEKGQMALLGHRTTRSHPFMDIDKLKPGNLLIVKDFVTQKKYTYEVTSNGDVRWGVKGVSINYQASEEPELWLVTCYPKGFSRAALIVHSKLASVEPLS